MGKLIILQNVKDNKTFPCAKFRFSSFPFVKVIMTKLFFQDKAFDPGLKLFEQFKVDANQSNYTLKGVWELSAR